MKRVFIRRPAFDADADRGFIKLIILKTTDPNERTDLGATSGNNRDRQKLVQKERNKAKGGTDKISLFK